MTETIYSDDDVLRAHNAEMSNSAPPPESGYGKSVMAAFHRAKKASVLNDVRSQRIVESLNKERVEKSGYKQTPVPTKHSQSNVMDF